MSVPDEKVFFVDTNIFLHYKWKDIDWLKHVGAKAVKLVVCYEVLKELDTFAHDSRYRKRVEHAHKHINAGGSIRTGVELVRFSETAQRQEMSDALSPDEADDRILQLMRQYRASVGTLDGIIAKDVSLEMRADVIDETVIAPPDEKHEPPGDTVSKENKRLKARVDELENCRPRLSFSVSAEGREYKPESVIAFNIRTKGFPPPLSVPDAMKTAEVRCPVLTEGMTGEGAFSISKATYERYSRERKSYLAAFKKYLHEHDAWAKRSALSFAADFWLCNSGGCPAKDVDVVMQFPDRFSCIIEAGSSSAREMLVAPKEPRPPVEPESNAVRVIRGLAGLSATGPRGLPEIPMHHNQSFQGQWCGAERVSDGFEVRMAVHSLKHHNQIRLGGIVAVFKSIEDIGTFPIPYTISVANDADLGDGKLVIKATPEKE